VVPIVGIITAVSHLAVSARLTLDGEETAERSDVPGSSSV
jgi:hypothetical protein